MEEFWINSDESTLYCRKRGTGQPLLMIHGACTDSDFFLDTALILSQYFTVVIYDRMGSGRSMSAGFADFSVMRHAKDAALIIRHIGCPCHVIAHSAGTTVAMQLAQSYPGLVSKMLLHEPVDSEFIERESDDEHELLEINSLVSEGRVSGAILRFLERLGETDPRARKHTPEEESRSDANCIHFIQNEFIPVFQFTADASVLKDTDITIGLGELSRSTSRWDIAQKISRKLNAPLVYYPGSHNCAFDLPAEFAYLSAGVLLTKT